ncbi:MAG: Ribonuclease VapC22 [Bacteroidia bacterium]|nr:Ribonuclease VapC22 [Bacteroidia bacterium]
MIIIDTHIWIWWVTNSPSLKKEHRSFLEKQKAGEIAINSISCWEVAKLVELGKLELNISVEQWLKEAVDYYNVTVLPLDIPVIVESTRLPGNFHKDPADQLIVATARVLDIPLLTQDSKILKYPFVKLFNKKSGNV